MLKLARSRCYSTLLSALISTWIVGVACYSNIDVDRPILREVSDLQEGSFFGYSLVLHQTSENPTTMAEALNGVK